MLKILVGHAYYLKYDRKQWERGKPYPPLATIQVAALLRRLGHEVALFDAMLAAGVEDFAASLHGVRPDLVVLYEDNFNFLTKMCLGRMREAACRMIAEARAAGARVIVAGSDASDHPEAFLAAGEVDGQLQPTRVGALPPDPRLVGHPAWDLIDIERYRAIWHQRHGYFSLNMAASRGCPFRCNWCAKPIWGNHYMQRSPQDVAAEMSHLKHAFQPDHIWMADDIFGFRVDWVTEFAEHLRATDGAVPFTIQTRADLISERMAEALAQAGCAEAWLGAESGSQRVLDAMNKGTRVPELIVARERLGRHGIRVGFFIQLGYLADLLATRELVAQAAPDDIGVSVSYPLPGTRFYELVKAQLGRKTHWRDSGDLAMMFRGAYDSEFYRSVRDLLHEQVALQQTKAGTPPKRHRAASAALAARWDALIAREHAHRNHDATPPPVPQRIAVQLR